MSRHDFKEVLKGVVFIKESEYNALNVYNTSYPTGVALGKRWIREQDDKNYVCEYVKGDPGFAKITMKRAIITLNQ